MALITTGSWRQTAATVAVVNKQDAGVHPVGIDTPRALTQISAADSWRKRRERRAAGYINYYIYLRSPAFIGVRIAVSVQMADVTILTSCYPEPGNRKVRGSTPPLATHMKIHYIHRSGEFTLHRDRYTFFLSSATWR